MVVNTFLNTHHSVLLNNLFLSQQQPLIILFFEGVDEYQPG